MWTKLWQMLVIIGAAFGLVFAFILRTQNPRRARERVNKEIKVLQENAKVERDLAQQGHEAAVSALEARHAATLQELSNDEKATADALRRDPRALSAFLVRAARD